MSDLLINKQKYLKQQVKIKKCSFLSKQSTLQKLNLKKVIYILIVATKYKILYWINAFEYFNLIRM